MVDENDDWTRDGDEPDEAPPREPRDGVRIIGAQEAREALEEGRVVRRRPEGEPRFGDRPRRAEPPERPAARFPLPADRSPALGTPPPRVGSSQLGELPGDEPPVNDRVSATAPLPHWTEPPSGESPRLPGMRDDTEDSGPTPRYRDTEVDWADSEYSAEELAKDEEASLGALADIPAEDEEEAFEREVELRRRVGPDVLPPSRRGLEATPPPEGAGSLEPGVPTPAAVRPGPGRDLPTAIVTGVAVAVAALLVLSFGRGPAAWLVALVAALAAAEMYATLRSRGYRPAAPVGLVGTAALVLVSYDRGSDGFPFIDRGFAAWPLVIMLVTVFSLLWYLARVDDARPLVNFAMTLVPFGYVGVLAGFGGLILAFPDGVGILLGAAIAAVAYDLFGYAIGARIGTTRIAPAVSPNKTVEGLLGGVTAAVVTALVVPGIIGIHPWDAGKALWLGVVVGVSAPMGDLIESMLKRDTGVKDFGNLLPGHGGVLDRFDAILFVLPGTFYLAQHLFL